MIFSRVCLLGIAGLLMLSAVGCAKKSVPNDESGLLVDSTPSSWGQDASESNSALAGNSDLVLVDKDLNMPTVYFAYNSDALQSGEKDKLTRLGDYLKNNTALYVIIEGHADQRGTEEYNRALSERRANMIRKFIADQGIDENRLRTISYGKDRPAVQGDTEDAWKFNRRGNFVPAMKK